MALRFKSMLCLAVGSVAALSAVGTTLAIFVDSPSDATLSIGLTHTPVVTLSGASNVSDDTGVLSLDTERTFDVDLDGITIRENREYSQPYILASVNVTIVAEDADFCEALTASYVDIDPDEEFFGTYFTDYYEADSAYGVDFDFSDSTVTAEDDGTYSITASRIMTVPATGDDVLTSTVHIALDSATTDSEFESWGGTNAPYSVEISTSREEVDDNWDVCLIAGTMNDWNKSIPTIWEMYPDPEEDGNSMVWMFDTAYQSIEIGAELKGYKTDDTWSARDTYGNDNQTWVEGYTILKWSGSGDDTVQFL